MSRASKICIIPASALNYIGVEIMTLKFRKEKLPNPLEYFEKNDIKILGRGEWRTALCPFHADTKPSLSVKIANGAFRCFACGAKGGDILAFHQMRFGMSFKDACKSLKAWS